MRSSPIGNTNLQIQAENMQAAESRISDADVATETTEFTCWAPLVSIARDTDVESLAKGVHVDLLPQSTALVDAVPELVRRAIGNVLRNAVHHTPGGRTVRVPLTAREGEDGPEALATVHDGGPGVPEEEPGRLFQPSHRLDSSRGHGTGTGLGLSIALRAIRLHGGAITAANDPRGGPRMEISLPLAR